MRPSFLQLGGEDKFADYQAEFNKLLPSTFTDFKGNRVVVKRDRCQHICYKAEEKNKGPRDQWRQDRAERIPFIKAALENPSFVCVGDGRTWVYLYQVISDTEKSLPPEQFCVIVDPKNTKPDQPGEIHLLTGYRISGQEWDNFKRNREWVHPPRKQSHPQSTKKKKGA